MKLKNLIHFCHKKLLKTKSQRAVVPLWRIKPSSKFEQFQTITDLNVVTTTSLNRTIKPLKTVQTTRNLKKSLLELREEKKF